MTTKMAILVNIILASPLAAGWSATEGETIRDLLNRTAVALEKKPRNDAELDLIGLELSRLRPATLASLKPIMEEMLALLDHAKVAASTQALEAELATRLSAVKIGP